MADDTNFRSYRPADQRWPAKANPSAGGHDRAPDRSDPLAELARLIGQTDPFGDLNKVSPPREASPGRPASVMPPAPMMPPAPFFQPPAPSVAADPYGSPLQFSEKNFAAPNRAEPAQESFQPAYDPAIYGMPQHQAPPAYSPETYHEEGTRMPQGNESYEEDDSEGISRRWPRYAMAAGVVLLLGTGGVFGYRAIFSGGSSGGVPPVIKANTTPSKVAAAPSANSKQINDRVGEVSQGERIVSREEKPLDVKDASRSVMPTRTVFPSLPGASNPVQPDSVMASGSPSLNTEGGSSAAEPKKIRTVTIVPDPNNGNAPTTRQTAAPRPATNASGPMPLAPTPPTRSAQSAPNAPLSLSPQIASAEPPASRPALPPAQTAARPTAPTRVAALPPAAADTPSGAYSVQISSQRSEAEAQASFRSLQGKFPSLLGDRQPIIRRADLGDKGIYFRTMVGGFTSQDQAKQFCGSLKSAGGQCVVPIN